MSKSKSKPEQGLFWCGGCARLLDKSEFHACKRTKTGLQSRCKDCQRARKGSKKMPPAAEMSLEQREERRKRIAKKWRDDNRAKMTAYMIEYRRANPERMRRISAENRKRNIDKIIIRNIQRRITQTNATPAWADKARISDLYLLAKTLSREAGIQFDVDHVVPLRGAVVCGLHCEANLRLLPRYENQKKHNYFQEVWP